MGQLWDVLSGYRNYLYCMIVTTPEKNNYVWYQVIAWMAAYLLFSLYLYQRLIELPYAVGIATSAFLFFALIIYIYALYLYPLLYKRGRPVLFLGSVVLLVVGASLLRVYVEYRFISGLYSQRSFFSGGKGHWAYVFVTHFMALLFGVLLKWGAEYFRVKAQQAAQEKKRLETEMKLLKAQLQPHFLFNSLNNIYYEAYMESPKTALLIEKLSGIMRYFFDINAREVISIGQEVGFIRSYIQLEQIRCHHPIEVTIHIEVDDKLTVPPMLMIPLVENIIKHGIDKRRTDNFIAIHILRTGNAVCFTARNRLLPAPDKENGTGLVNLEERMKLLFGDKYQLSTSAEEGVFTASLKIPVQ